MKILHVCDIWQRFNVYFYRINLTNLLFYFLLGLRFKLSPRYSNTPCKLSYDLNCMRSSKDAAATALGDQKITYGVHYWRANVEKCGSGNRNATLAVGVAKSNAGLEQLVGKNLTLYSGQTFVPYKSPKKRGSLMISGTFKAGSMKLCTI